MKTNSISPTGPVLLKVRSFLKQQDLVGEGKKLLVAVSGGPDSVCLLHVLAGLQKELNIRLHVAHLDHGLRGKESTADAAYVARLANKLNLPVTIEKRDVNAFRLANKLSLEAAAREVRYSFFSELLRELEFDAVAVAHTGNDHIETVLMHLIRGSGVRGLQGLRPINRWRSGENSLLVVRPLLAVSREETVTYCEENHLRPRTDSSNLSLTPFRNKIRLELLPLLKKYNPRISDALQRTSLQAEEMAGYLDAEALSVWDKVVRQEDEGFLLDKREFLSASSVLQKGLLILMLEKLLGSLTDIESRHIDEIMSACSLPAGRRVNLPDNLVFTVDYDNFVLSRGAGMLVPLPPLEGEIKLKIPGETKYSGWRIVASISDGASFPVIPGDAGIQKADGFTAYLDMDRIGRNLKVRAPRPGDVFQPLGMEKTKKVARFLLDARVPRPWRERIPVVLSPRQIVWVAGWRIDERAKITEGTRNALRLDFQRHP